MREAHFKTDVFSFVTQVLTCAVLFLFLIILLVYNVLVKSLYFVVVLLLLSRDTKDRSVLSIHKILFYRQAEWLHYIHIGVCAHKILFYSF